MSRPEGPRQGLIKRLGYIRVPTPNVDAWRTFAAEILGTPEAEPPADGGLRLRIDGAHHRLAIVPSPEEGLPVVGWDVGDSETLERAVATLDQAGVACQRGSDADCHDRRVQAMIALEDPSGVPVELFHSQEQLYGPPAKPTRPDLTGFVALGHAVLAEPAYDEAVDFYTRVLEFRLTDYRRGLSFLHCSNRHHSLGVGKLPRPGLHHVMIEVAALDDVGHAYDLVQARGVPITATLGRHVNDQVVSFYIRSPSGFEVEYAWGSREINPATWTSYEFVNGDTWGHQRQANDPVAVKRGA